MHAPNLNALGTVIARTLSRRTSIKYVAGAAIATALGMADRAKTTLSASPARPTEVNQVRQLSGLDGVALAMEWTPDGTLVNVESTLDLPRELATVVARYGAAVNGVAPGFTDVCARATGSDAMPYRALVVYGGEWAAVIGSGNRGVWVDPTRADINLIVRAVEATDLSR
ncbi:MAG: DUF2173 family protein [Chloroflexota bacterium]|nr:DUF2173 family protein [Chloroflexota bacterium]